MWPKFLRNYFGFNRQQGRGLFLLVILCVLVVMFRLLLPFFETESDFVLKTLPSIDPDSLQNISRENSHNSQIERVQKPPFPFDPNQVNYEELIQLGIKPSSAKAWVNFRKKGFVFRKKTDITKVYGIQQEEYARLEPYLKIEKEVQQVQTLPAQSTPSVAPPVEKKETKIIDINSADSLSLLELRGIGPTFAKRIIAYRKLLGGFYSIEQIKEVYGVDEQRFAQIQAFLKVNPELILKLRLNSDDFKTLNRHPYISYELTQKLVNARKKNKLDELSLKTIVSDEKLYEKLRFYCSFD